MTRYQKNEIVKYIRTRIPIFMSQIQQLLQNVLGVFVGLSVDEKAELVNYLVPEVSESAIDYIPGWETNPFYPTDRINLICIDRCDRGNQKLTGNHV